MRAKIAMLLAGVVLGCQLLGCQPALAQEHPSPLPDLPPDVPKDGDVRIMLSDKTPQGQDVVWTDSAGTVHEFFQFNDRGRGPKIYTTYHFDSAGMLAAEQSSGVDYMKNPVVENFALRDGAAEWKNQSEEEKRPNASGKYYIDLNGGPESQANLARALLRNNGKLPVLPSGEGRIRQLKTMTANGAGKTVTVTLYELTGLSTTPSYIWLDDTQKFFAATDTWFSVIRHGYEESVNPLLTEQQVFEHNRGAELAKRLTHQPAGGILVVKNVSVFDSPTGKVLLKQRITVQGERILSMEEEHGQSPPANAEVLDGTGKMALPGLWDMHHHTSATSALGNPIDELAKLRENIASGKQIGPRIIAAGFIDGRGPFQGPIAVFADTPEEAIAKVDHYADLGYVQIKIYSSMKPELVPIIAKEAHRRGLRVSGHVPSQMIAEQFVRDGADEIQHINFIMLNFMPDVKETRNPDRFIMPGRRSAALDLNSDAVNNFVKFLREHHTVVDPTMAIFESTYTDRPGKIGATETAMFDRLPVQDQRGVKAAGEALPAADAETDQLYRASWAKMIGMLKKMYDGGVQIVAGTDEGSGYALHREMEIYQEAGIPTIRILQIATIEAATLTKRDKELGSITPGKYADILLVPGDPTRKISDIRKTDTVIQGGKVLKPADLYAAIGIRPN